MSGATSMYVVAHPVHVLASRSPGHDWRAEGVSALWGGARSEVATYRPSGPGGGSCPAGTPNGPGMRAGDTRLSQLAAVGIDQGQDLRSGIPLAQALDEIGGGAHGRATVVDHH